MPAQLERQQRAREREGERHEHGHGVHERVELGRQDHVRDGDAQEQGEDETEERLSVGLRASAEDDLVPVGKDLAADLLDLLERRGLRAAGRDVREDADGRDLLRRVIEAATA
jgi:hypothetical protein